MTERRRAALTWLAIVAPLWVTFALCCHWEPIIGDSWGHLHWHRIIPMSLEAVLDFAKGAYLHNNPRFGQVLTFLVMTPGPWHAMITPVVELAMFVFATTLVLGRWPRPSSRDDAVCFLVVTAVMCACSPAIGQMLFYRPFAGNYTFGFVINLAWLIPYRLRGEAAAPRALAWWGELLAAAGMFALGAVAGECNEHTPPAVGMLAVAFAWPVVRARGGVRPWLIAGLVGLAAGWLALLFAPGQDIRYDGLAHEASLLGRIAERGIPRDAFLILKPYLYLLVGVPWLVIAAVARHRSNGASELTPATRLALVALAAASLVVAVTLLGSPKEGERLYFAAIAFAAIAIAGATVAATRTTPRLRLATVVLSAVVLAFGCERCIETLAVVGPESDERIDILSHAAPGSTPTVPRFSREHSRWFGGEDTDERRRITAHDFGLADIQLAP